MKREPHRPKASQEIDESMLPIIMECIGVILYEIGSRARDPVEEVRVRPVGSISIIADEKDDVSRFLGAIYENAPKNHNILQVDSREGASFLEYEIVRWAHNPEQISEIIKALDPRYATPTWGGKLLMATDDVVDIFLGAIIIDESAPIYNLLSDASKKPLRPKKSGTWILDPSPSLKGRA